MSECLDKLLMNSTKIYFLSKYFTYWPSRLIKTSMRIVNPQFGIKFLCCRFTIREKQIFQAVKYRLEEQNSDVSLVLSEAYLDCDSFSRN